MKKISILLVGIYLLCLVAIGISDTAVAMSYRGQEIFLYITGEDGKTVNACMTDTLADIENTEVNSFIFYLVRELPAELRIGEKPYPTLVRTLSAYSYAHYLESRVHAYFGDFDADAPTDRVVLYGAVETDASCEGQLCFGEACVSVEIKPIAGDMAVLGGGHFADYAMASRGGFLTADMPVSLVTRDAFLRYYALCEDTEAELLTFSEIPSYGVLVKLPSNHALSYADFSAFIETFTQNGYTVQHNLPAYTEYHALVKTIVFAVSTILFVAALVYVHRRRNIAK